MRSIKYFFISTKYGFALFALSLFVYFGTQKESTTIEYSPINNPTEIKTIEIP